jgi:hypothetical protein
MSATLTAHTEALILSRRVAPSVEGRALAALRRLPGEGPAVQSQRNLSPITARAPAPYFLRPSAGFTSAHFFMLRQPQPMQPSR